MATALAAAAPLAPLAARAAMVSPVPPEISTRRIRKAILVPRFGADASADWYPAALRQLADLDIRMEVIPLLPKPTAPAIEDTLTAIDKAIAHDPQETNETILIGHSVGSRALLAYIHRRAAYRSFAGLVSVAGWFTVDDLKSYPVLAPWVNMKLDYASITLAAGPISVHLSDNDPFTKDWRANAAQWLRKLGATVHVAHGAGHYMTPTLGPVLDTIRVASRPHTQRAPAWRAELASNGRTGR